MQVFKQQIQKLFLSLLLFGLSLYQPIIAQRNLSDYVNTLQGTNSKFELTRGNTYPTTALPFGMNTWTPQTGPNGDGWKYQYFKETIRGFQQAHTATRALLLHSDFSLESQIFGQSAAKVFFGRTVGTTAIQLLWLLVGYTKL